MYSDYKKQPGQEVTQTNGKEKHDDAKESEIPQIVHGRSADRAEKHSKRLPTRYFVTTKRRREYFETRSKKR